MVSIHLGSIALLAAALWAGPVAAQADARPTLAYLPGIAAPHGFFFSQADALFAMDGLRLVAPGETADFAVMPARSALARRLGGAPVRIIYVLSRAGVESEVLVVSERMLSDNPSRVEGVVALFERSRRWIGAHDRDVAGRLAAQMRIPVEAAQAALAGRDFQVARPGPALAQVLKADIAPALAAQVDALLDDKPARAALRAFDAPAKPLLVSQR